MGRVEIFGFDRLLAGVGLNPTPQFVGVSVRGSVYSRGGGEKGIESEIPVFSKGGPY